MTDEAPSPEVDLALPAEDLWILHHVLLDRIEQEVSADQASIMDSPPIECYRAFDVLDSGGTSVTIDQLIAIRTVLAEHHHSSPAFSTDRSNHERLLYHIGDLIDQHQSALHAE